MSSKVTSEKWISTSDEVERKVSETEGRLILHNVKPLFQPVWNTNTNIISVFGRARQGKSFLMNCLSGEQSLFKVSNYKESCTQGIDISSKFMTLNEFSRVDGGRGLTAAPRSEIKVGFVDAEGQGDRDVSYDANLICPILLASKCVIFNWKGDLQKDHILSTLGIMTRAAKNVSGEGEEGRDRGGAAKKKFGHLHIVFRDWQSVGSDEASVTDILFSIESGKDAMTRNQIREEVTAAFSSIRVWLFEAPTDSIQALRQVLTVDVTTPRFRQQVRDFRGALALQLSEPVLFAQRPLTGKTICSMMTDVVKTLNRGDVILPASTYLTMMKEEVTSLMHSFDEEVKAVVTQAVTSVDRDRRHVIDSLSLYLNTSDALQVFRGLADVALQSSLRLIHDVIGLPPSSTTTSNTPYDLLYRESESRLRRQVSEGEKSFELHYLKHYLDYLRQTRQRLEGEIKVVATSLFRTPPRLSSLKECSHYLEVEVVQRHVSQVNPSDYYTSATSGASPSVKQEIDDVIALLRRFSLPLLQRCVTSYEEVFQRRQEKMDEISASIRQSMETFIPAVLQRLTSQHKKGFAKSVLNHALDQEYQRLDTQLHHLLNTLPPPTPPPSTTVVSDYSNAFYEYCTTLKEACEKEYDALKEKHMCDQFSASESLLNEELEGLARHWETQCEAFLSQLASDDVSSITRELMDADEAKRVFENLIANIWRQAIDDVIGWLSDSIPSQHLSDEVFLRQTSFGLKLHAFLSDNVTPFLEGFVSVLGEIEAQRQATLLKRQRKAEEEVEEEEEEDNDDDVDHDHDNFTVPMDIGDMDDEDIEEEEEGDDTSDDVRAAQRALSKARKGSRVTVEEQRRRARDFAERVLGVSFASSKKKKKIVAATKTKKGGVSSTSKVKSKSLLQQREAAKEFAVRHFGSAILESDGEEELQENVRHNSGGATDSGRKKRGHDDVSTGDDDTLPLSSSSAGRGSVLNKKDSSRKRVKLTHSDDVSTARQQSNLSYSLPLPLPLPCMTSSPSLSSNLSLDIVDKSHVTPTKPAPTTTTQAKASSGKKATSVSAATENSVMAARRAAEEERQEREREAIERATRRIQEQQKKKKKQAKTSKK